MVLYYTAHQVQSLSKASPRFTLYRLSSEAPPKRLASLYLFINIAATYKSRNKYER